jgi:large subunit ribosomal protein L13
MTPYTKSTASAKAESIERKWLVVDAANQTLGRLAAQVAQLLRGKHKPLYTPHVDCGDHVIVINASKIYIDPKREERKQYYHNTLYPGGARFRAFSQLKKERPEEIIELAVAGMLPKTSLGKAMIKKLRVYGGAEHQHAAQQPVPYTLAFDSQKRTK